MQHARFRIRGIADQEAGRQPVTRKRARSPLHIESDGSQTRPAGAAIDRYEALMMMMIASRVLEAYDDSERARRAEPGRRLRKLPKSRHA
jgi:hypothetical protein